jgi:tripartite-type tricarboxylate transporter receptor subunit TctC
VGGTIVKFRRRTFVHLAAGAAALPALSRGTRADSYPSRPARIVVGFPAGGATDIFARLMADWLSQRLGQQFLVDNKPGVSGNIGTEAVARAPADGYTLLQIVTQRRALQQSQFRFQPGYRAGEPDRAACLRRRGASVGARQDAA